MRTEACNAKPKAENTDEILCYGGRKGTDRAEDEAAAYTAVRRLYPQDGD